MQPPSSGQSYLDDLLRKRDVVFPGADQQRFFAYCSMSPLPKPVGDALRAYADRHAVELQNEFLWEADFAEAAPTAPWADDDYQSTGFDPLYHPRYQVARYLRCKTNEVAFVGNTALGLGMVAESLPLKDGDRVLTVEGDFPANVLPWTHLGRKGVKVDAVPLQADWRLTIQDILACLRPDTKVVTVSAVHYLTGQALPLEEVGHELRKRGVWFVVDTIQGWGNVRVDATWADVMVAGGQKWLMSPKGSGVMTIREEVLHHLVPTPMGWLSVVNKGDFLNLDSRIDPAAKRFELGTNPVPAILGLAAAFRDIFTPIGSDILSGRVRQLAAHVRQCFRDAGFTPLLDDRPDEEQSGITCVPVQNNDAEAIMQQITSEHGIVFTIRPDWAGRPCVRLAPHICTIEKDIESAIGVLREHYHPFRSDGVR